MAANSTKPEAIVRAENKRKALQLRMAGWTQKAIADELNLSTRTISTYIRDEIAAIPAEAADELRQMQVERLQQQLVVVYGRSLVTEHGECKARYGHTFPDCEDRVHQPARNEVRTIMRELNNLQGLDAPKEVNVAQTTGVLVIGGADESYVKSLQQLIGIEAPAIIDDATYEAQQRMNDAHPPLEVHEADID